MGKYSIQYIGETLKKARLKKGWSQRELASKAGVPQSHISKIESGLVNLQASSLIELSRFLDLELMLVPRQLIPTVLSLRRGIEKKQHEPRPMYQLDEDDDE